MRIAFSVDDDRGLDSTVSHHFGRCPYYVLVDLAGGKPASIRTVENPYYGNHQPGQVPRFIHSQGAQVIISGGMGRRALAFFQDDNVEPVTGAHGTVERALQEFLSGRLTGAAPCRDSMHHEHREHSHAPDGVEAEEQSEVDRLRDRVEALEQKLAQALNRKDGSG
jgi:predicted Fe-Mo cluster-binding NifX family protein